jgi:hypothetical protein
MRCILTFEFVKNNNDARSGFALLEKKRDGFTSAKKGGGMILRLLKGKGMISGLFENKQDAILPYLKHCLSSNPYVASLITE